LHRLLHARRRSDVKIDALQLIVDFVLCVSNLIYRESSGDASHTVQQVCVKALAYIQNLMTHDRGRVENTPINADFSVKRARVALARQVFLDPRVVDSEVYFIYGGGATVQMHAGSLMRPYNLMST
jgi:hypothetical protein